MEAIKPPRKKNSPMLVGVIISVSKKIKVTASTTTSGKIAPIKKYNLKRLLKTHNNIAAYGMKSKLIMAKIGDMAFSELV